MKCVLVLDSWWCVLLSLCQGSLSSVSNIWLAINTCQFDYHCSVKCELVLGAVLAWWVSSFLLSKKSKIWKPPTVLIYSAPLWSFKMWSTCVIFGRGSCRWVLLSLQALKEWWRVVSSVWLSATSSSSWNNHHHHLSSWNNHRWCIVIILSATSYHSSWVKNPMIFGFKWL